MKNVLHDVVTKLGARSRSQAVAHAVREGLDLTSVADLLAGRRIVVCAGSGGVGKTTTAAALAMGAAAEGAKVAVVTIDPARRLANSLGLEELGQRAAPDRPGALHRARGRDARRAVGADARRQAHVRRADRAPRAGRPHARRGALEPDLPAALQRRGRLAGVHGDRQALRPRRERRLRPARARHAAVAQRARLPRRARRASPASSRAARSRSSSAPPASAGGSSARGPASRSGCCGG